VRKTYRDAAEGTEVLALDGLTLDIEPREFLTLLGPSGCGKSTLLNILAGFEKPDAGKVLLNGVPIERPGPDRGVVFRTMHCFTHNIKRNVEYSCAKRPRQERNAPSRNFLAMVGLSGSAPHPAQLSGGTPARRAVSVLTTRILLMDEPFAAGDAQTRTILPGIAAPLDTDAQDGRVRALSVDGAIYLADRVTVMTARPGVVRRLCPLSCAATQFNIGQVQSLSAARTQLIEVGSRRCCGGGLMAFTVYHKHRLYSITSSARARKVRAPSKPSAFAVLRLTTRSNLTGCSTGKSAGLYLSSCACIRRHAETSLAD
jgi:NitT/TauT family transport system ATP-binding protein